MIDFTANGQQIDFSLATKNIPQYTLAFRFRADSFGHVTDPTLGKWGVPLMLGDVSTVTFIANNATTVKNILFSQTFSTTSGAWRTNSAPPIGSYEQVVITYDATSTGNDPVIYINGAAVATTEIQTPSGSADTSLSGITIGSDGTKSFDGVLLDVRVYNRILSAQEVSELWQMACVTSNDWGLVFHANLDGAAGIPDFQTPLAAENILVDRIGGATGVPTGGPVGASDVIMTWGGW